MKQSYVCSYEVAPASDIEFTVKPDSNSADADGSYTYEDADGNKVTGNIIPIAVSAKGSEHVLTTWS